ncbi:hypothetical protein STPYR_10250 [uncultured Stenotrophomonas sp.]|uniref:Uncharacterized protein n=1 Tax=uncultured Stenotrophomonas sp. TaxID=165438 RepID=A0A1Y5PZC4_9GAMM|nr:hypothetical protein STPYR_10250 [uncultured Stenotrophomonas sp.]
MRLPIPPPGRLRRRIMRVYAAGVNRQYGLPAGAGTKIRRERIWPRMSMAEWSRPRRAYNKKPAFAGFCLFESWCPGEDSNLHGFTR